MKDKRLVGIPVKKHCPKCGIRRKVVEFSHCTECGYQYGKMYNGVDTYWNQQFRELRSKKENNNKSFLLTPEEFASDDT